MSDDRLLELLSSALGSERPVPPELTGDARAVFAWRTVDAELLELGFDSAVDELAGVRAADLSVRLLRFSAAGLDVELEAHPTGLHGHVTGAAVTEAVLERPGAPEERSRVDEYGRFSFSGDLEGPVRILLIGDEEEHLTQWFLLADPSR